MYQLGTCLLTPAEDKTDPDTKRHLPRKSIQREVYSVGPMKLLRRPVRESSFFRPKNRNFLVRKVWKPWEINSLPEFTRQSSPKANWHGLTCRRKLPMTHIDLYAQCVRPSEQERGEEKSLVAFSGEHGRGKRMENRAATLLISIPRLVRDATFECQNGGAPGTTNLGSR
jgi:hypothetical protein